MPPIPAPRLRARAWKLPVLAVLLLVVLPQPALALRVVSWNILNYPTSDGNSREDDFRLVLSNLQPDLIVAQEITGGTSGATEFLTDVLNVLEPGEWAMAPFTDGYDSDNACYYKTAELDYLSRVILDTALRDINGWRLRPDGYSDAASELWIWSLHLKASTGTDNEDKRLAEATILRNHLNTYPAGTNILVGGDYNIYTSTEPAWQKLTGSEADNDGRVFDPINRVGSWHNNTAYVDIHTQSTRTTTLPDGGSTGGMDDRFDHLLANDDMLDGEGLAYVAGSFVVYGQDGLHFNSAINASPTNAAVGQTIANALHASSDHLPVVLDVQLPARVAVSADLAFGPVLVGALAQRLLTVQNTVGVPGDDLDYTAGAGTGFSVPTNTVSVPAGGTSTPVVTVNTTSAAQFSTSVTVASDDPDQPLVFVPATADVVNPSVPSLDGLTQILGGTVDFGSHKAGEFTNQSVLVHNLDYESLQALLQVYDASISGADASRFSVLGFTPTLVGGTAAGFTIAFDDGGAAEETSYSATLLLSTRDDPDVIGALDRPGLTLDLEAYVQSSGVAVDSPAKWRTALRGNVPNPFNPSTSIRFELRAPVHARLEIFDVRGRLVRVLVDEALGAGPQERVWDGRDSRGRAMASGVFFYRLRADGVEETRRMTLVR